MTLTVFRPGRPHPTVPISPMDWEQIARLSELGDGAKGTVEFIAGIGQWVGCPLAIDSGVLTGLAWTIERLTGYLRRVFEDGTLYGVPGEFDWDEIAAERRPLVTPITFSFAITQMEIIRSRLRTGPLESEHDVLVTLLAAAIDEIATEGRRLLDDAVLYYAIWGRDLDRSDQRYWSPARGIHPIDVVGAGMELDHFADRLRHTAARMAKSRGRPRDALLDLQVLLLDKVMVEHRGRHLVLGNRSVKRKVVPYPGYIKPGPKPKAGREQGDLLWVHKVCAQARSVNPGMVRGALERLVKRRTSRSRDRTPEARLAPEWSLAGEIGDLFYIAEISHTS